MKVAILLVLLFALACHGERTITYKGHKLTFGCLKMKCWSYCGASWVSEKLAAFISGNSGDSLRVIEPINSMSREGRDRFFNFNLYDRTGQFKI